MAVKLRGNKAGAAGTVKLYTAAHRYGFIVPDAGGNDVFVDHNAVNFAGLQDRMVKGFRVTFDLVPDARGRRGSFAAVNLAPVETVDDPAARIHQLENVVRQLFDALPAETRLQMRELPGVADIVDAEPRPREQLSA